MTRGKYAKRAADKRAELEVTTDLASYQRRVARLTAENRELRERLESERDVHKKVERRLRAERDEGIGPQIEAMRLTLQAERTKHAQRLRMVAKCIGDMIESHGWAPRSESWNDLAALLGNVPELITPSREHAPNRNARRADPKRIRHIMELQDSGRLDGKNGPPPTGGKKVTDP